MNKNSLGALVLLGLLSACGGGGGGDSTPTPTPSPSPTPTPDPSPTPGPSPTPSPSPSPAPGTSPSPSSTDYIDRANTPRRINIQPVSGTSAYVGWVDASSDETGFIVERSSSSTGPWTEIGRPTANTTLFQDNTVAANTTYYYRVTVNRVTSGQNIPSAPVAVTMPANGSKIWIVDANASNASNSNLGTEAAPLATLQGAHTKMAGGDTVLVKNGTYTSTAANSDILNVTKSGTASSYSTFPNFPGHKPLLKATYDKTYNAVKIMGGVSYVIIDGFEMEGTALDSRTANDAKAVRDAILAAKAASAPTNLQTPKDSCNGVTVQATSANPSHHIIIRNNLVRDFPGGGISAISADYITIDNNRIRNVAKYSTWGASGISLLTPENFGSDTTNYRQVISNNVISDADNLYECECTTYTQVTDGNGIILDKFLLSNYVGKVLVMNNVVFNVGARGIHAYKAQNVDIFYNTTVGNGFNPATNDGEITSIQSTNVRVYNNIMIGRSQNDTPINSNSKSTGGTLADFSNNIAVGGKVVLSAGAGTGNRTSNPYTATASALLSSLNANVDAYKLALQLASGSIAVDSANTTLTTPTIPQEALDKDVFGAPRPRGVKNDVGAVESL
jgi:hypothetical protein